MLAALTALANALGPWPLAVVLIGAFAIVVSAIVIIVLRSKIALDISRNSKNKWRIRFVRIEQGGRIGEVPLFTESDSTKSKPPISRHIPSDKSR